MSISVEIARIEVQPDKLVPLKGKNEYDLLRLKRAVISGIAHSGSTDQRFRIVFDARARLFRLTITDSPIRIAAATISTALMQEFTRLSRFGEPMLLVEQSGDGREVLYAVDSPIDPVALSHFIKETGTFGR